MENEISKPDYELYDRQLCVFCNSVETLTVGWREYSSTELSMDLNSMCIKGARLCYMADQDAVWQREDLKRSRSSQNLVWHDRLKALLTDHLMPMFMAVVKNVRSKIPFVGVKLPRYKGDFADFLPYLEKSLCEDGVMEEAKCDEMIASAILVQRIIYKQNKKKPQGESPEMRFWHLGQLYALTCYLYYHFHKQAGIQQQDPDAGETERLLVATIQGYTHSVEGQRAQKTLRARLVFDNDGCEPNREQLLEAGKRLVTELPENLQYCYMAYRNDMARMAEELITIKPNADELQKLVETISRWQMLHEMIYQIDHPTASTCSLDGSIFNTSLNGRPLDRDHLRGSIARMVQKVEYKNQWFCVWCVLKHRNLLADLHFQAFADQMMQPEWFGREKVPAFKGENISDYSEYLGQTDFTQWSLKGFQDYRALHAKPVKKWSDKLFNTFHHLCYEMDECFA